MDMGEKKTTKYKKCQQSPKPGIEDASSRRFQKKRKDSQYRRPQATNKPTWPLNLHTETATSANSVKIRIQQKKGSKKKKGGGEKEKKRLRRDEIYKKSDVNLRQGCGEG